MRRFLVFLAAVLAAAPMAMSQTAPATSGQATSSSAAPISITAKTVGMDRLHGYVPLYWDSKAGKMWLEAGDWGTEFLYIEGLPAGIGSNDIGLDRGQLGRTRVVRWERSGPKVLLVEPNYEYRAVSDSPDERRTVRESFAESVIGDSMWRRRRAGACWWTPHPFFCAIRMTLWPRCGEPSKELFILTPPAARSFCRARGISR